MSAVATPEKSANRVIYAVILCVLTGCQSIKLPVPSEGSIPAAFDVGSAQAQQREEPASPTAWWRDYHDEVLNQLVDLALSHNPDIDLALAHLREAEAIDSSAWTKEAPGADVGAGGGHGTSSDNSRGRVGSVLGSADNNKTLTHLTSVGGVEATWQVDLTGRIANQVKAIHANTEALRAARLFLVSTIEGDVVQNYAITRGLQAQLALNGHSREVTDQLYQLVENRAKLGLASELDLAQVRRDRDKTRADEHAIQIQLSLAENKLASITGVYRSELMSLISPAQPIPVAGGKFRTGVPLTLIERRGDIQFAALELVAAKAEHASEVARLFPSLSFSAAAGEQRQDLAGLPAVSQHIWSVGPAVFWPILDFGALDADIEVSRWRAKEALIRYKSTIQRAVSDVETNANAYAKALDRVATLETALEASHRSAQLAQNRFENGLTDYLHVIDALRQEDQIAKEYAEATVQAAIEWAALEVSLGQGQSALPITDHPFVPKPAVVALFRQLLAESTTRNGAGSP